jgi:hypothetical protein
LTLTPLRPGRPFVRVLGSADGNLRTEATRSLAATQRALTLGITGPPTRYLNRLTTWDVRVANAGEAALEGVQVRVQVPPEVSFRAATGGGQLVTDQVVWSIGALRPGEKRDLQLTATPVKAAPRVVLVGVASADKVAEQRAESAFEVLGMSALRVDVTAPSGPVEVNGKAVYAIRVVNQGTLAAQKVAVTAVLPQPFLQPRYGTGPTLGQVQGERVVFAPLERVEPGQTVVYQVEATAKQAGDARVRVELRSDAAPAPVVTEEATRVVEPSRQR